MDPAPDSQSPFLAGLAEVEHLLHEGAPSSLSRARALAGQLVDNLPETPSGGNSDLRIAILTAKGHAERNAGFLPDAVRTYDRALSLLPDPGSDVQGKNRRANLLTCRGLALLALGDPASLERAIESFDASITMRDMPEATEAECWGLAAAWLNRGDALAALGGRDQLRNALAAAAKGREALAGLDPDKHPPYRSRLALSWMKSGDYALRLCAECGELKQEESLSHLETAVAVLRPGAEAGFEESRRMLAAALANLSRARLFLEKRGSESGEREARESLSWIETSALTSPEMLSLALNCRLTEACHLVTSGGDADRLLAATDVVEEAFALAAEGRDRLGPAADDERLLGELAKLGAEAYLIASPAFLGEFLLDLLDPDRNPKHFADLAAVHEAAVRVLWRGIAGIQQRGFSEIGSSDYETDRDRLVEWQNCRERLASIRDRFFTRGPDPA